MTNEDLHAIREEIRMSMLNDEGMTYSKHLQLLTKLDELIALARRALAYEAGLAVPPTQSTSGATDWRRDPSDRTPVKPTLIFGLPPELHADAWRLVDREMDDKGTAE